MEDLRGSGINLWEVREVREGYWVLGKRYTTEPWQHQMENMVNCFKNLV